MSDEDLMLQLQMGAELAFDILFSRHQKKTTAFLFRIVHNWEEAEDLLQEAFLRVHRNRHSYNNFCKFSTWLYSIARNLALSAYRKKRYEVIAVDWCDDDKYGVHDSAISPEKYTESVIQGYYIQEALNKMRPRHREVIILRDVQQMTYLEIAEVTGLPLGSVKSKINRGRKQLGRLLMDVYAPAA